MALAQLLITTVYLMFGVYVYAMQGQYTLALAYQGIATYAFQTVCNVIAVITGSIAAALCKLSALSVALNLCENV